MKGKIISIVAVSLLCVGLYGQEHSIFKEFQDPDREYTIAPLWSWNGTLDPNEVKRQIDLMIDKGVYGAFMHARDGINLGDTPYFSDGWWEAMDSTIAHSERMGFYSWLYDEDKWPSGSAGGRIVAKNPEEFVKKSLTISKQHLKSGDICQIEKQGKLKVFALRMRDNNWYDSKIDLTLDNSNTWKVPDGNWTILTFVQVKYNSPYEKIAHIDYLDKDAVRAFIDVTHEEYFKRYGNQFGSAIQGIFFDEIRFDETRYTPIGESLPWTDDFAISFEKRKGYDILDELPSLVYQTSGSESVNFDFFDELTYRYDQAWFKQLADWCEEHDIGLTGHTEENFDSYKGEGDYLRTVGSMQIPGTDNEDFRYNFPRYVNWYKPKQLSSVAHIYGRKMTAVEAMGGGGYMIKPEEYRYGMASLGVYGINFFIPHFFHYSDEHLRSYTDWPPSWFFRNPYWKYFKPLADYGKRISYMNRTGSHVCHVAVLFPLTELWASGYGGHVEERDHKMVQEILLRNQIDYDVMNPDALLKSNCSSGKIELHDESYKVLVIPSINRIRLETARKISEFYVNGGIVIALDEIPHLSIHGNNKEVSYLMSKIFGIRPDLTNMYYDVEQSTFKPYITNVNEKGGKGYYSKSMLELPNILKNDITDELNIVEGKHSALRFMQYKKDNLRYYMLMNGERESNSFEILVPDYGIPYKMDIETGMSYKIESYVTLEDRLLVSLDFKPWEAFYFLFEEGDRERKDVMLSSTSLDDAKLKSDNKELIISGWANPEVDNFYSIKYSNGAEYRRVVRTQDSFKPLQIGGDWEFQIVDKQLDDKWTDQVKESVIDIPIMKFYANLDNKQWNFISTSFNDRNLPEVKLADRFSNIKGAARYLSCWNASSIIYYDKVRRISVFEGQNVIFRKTFNLHNVPAESELRISAEPAYTLFINGNKLGSGSELANVGTYNIASFLKEGYNAIIVEVPQQIGFIAEGSIESDRDFVLLNTDDTWEASIDGKTWETALVFCKPSLGNWKDVEFNNMKSIQFPVTCWYRQELPAGAEELILPERSGSFAYYVNGEQLKESNGRIKLLKAKDYEKQILAIKAVVRNYNDGLQSPIKVVCRETSTELAPWNELGLKWFSGRAVYKNEFEFSYDLSDDKYKFILDPGDVKHFLEIWINGQLVKYCPWGDFKTDITKYLKKGKNSIRLIVSNLRANETIWDVPDERLVKIKNDPIKKINEEFRYWHTRWWQQGATIREKERLESGLLGPVRIFPMQYVEIKHQK